MEICSTLPSLAVSRTACPSRSISSCSSTFFDNSFSKKSIKSNCLVLRSRSRAQRPFKCTALFGLGVPELVVIAGVAAVVFGPKKLPEVGRSIGKTIKSFQQAAKEFESELKKEPEAEIEDSGVEKPTAISEDKKQETKIPNT